MNPKKWLLIPVVSVLGFFILGINEVTVDLFDELGSNGWESYWGMIMGLLYLYWAYKVYKIGKFLMRNFEPSHNEPIRPLQRRRSQTL